MTFSFSDLIFDVINPTKRTRILSEKYIVIRTQPNFQIKLNEDKIQNLALTDKTPGITYGLVKHNELLREISELLPQNQAFLLHSASFEVDGRGVVFCAISGTGKTTHMLNWQKLLKDKLTIINGDKPFIRFFDKDFCKKNNLNIPDGTKFGIPYAYGSPWCGKENLSCNMRTPLKHICFIERSETNFVTKISKEDAVNRIMQQVYIPKDPVALSKTLELVNRLINSCNLWIIHCNMEPESAEVAYKAIFGN